MSNTLNSKDFGLKIYNKFPPKYIEDDAMQNYALRRYLQALSDGGFKHTIDEINGLISLIDPNNTSKDVLSILFEQYGLKIFNGIPEQYLRYLLPRLGNVWSQKGSLSAVEFITSSISGIKTSTDVVYDENDDPTINVRLEMDYSLSDYFPESEQLKRLLENFVPFYSDLVIIYSYIFFESKTLYNRENDFINITDTKYEDCPLKSADEHISYVIKQILNESSNLPKDSDDYVSIIKYAIIHLYGKLKTVEHLQDKLSICYSEGSAFTLIKKDPSNMRNALFGEAIMGVSTLGGFEYVDTYEEHIKDTKEETAIFKQQSMDSLLNRGYNTLNGNFYTNSYQCYDKITIGGATESVFSY